MTLSTRKQKFSGLFPNEPAFRWRQIEQALFNPANSGWFQLTTLPEKMKAVLDKEIAWLAVRDIKILNNKNRDTFKAALRLSDGLTIESVLMKNSRGQFTVCVSTQVGCGIGCRFCATGQGGLSRNLTEDEITDQYRFWLSYLSVNFNESNRISNLVLMGMGEPLLNYDNVKSALNILLKYTDIGETRITVSTVGLFPLLDDLSADKDWPNVRVAISLHGADFKTRQQLIPKTAPDFFPNLIRWSNDYLKIHGNRRHHLSFEYIMISGLNDGLDQADKLVKLIKKIGLVKVNLIPCNIIDDSEFGPPTDKNLLEFQHYLNQNGVTATIRKSMGQDIDAACGQLAKKQGPPNS